MSIRLIVGLGNPGERYRNTRHNIGFLLLDRLISSGDWEEWKDFGDVGRYGWVGLEGRRCLLMRPGTHMNDSGRMVSEFIAYHKEWAVPTSDMLVCFDDLALPLARLRLRARGSSGGHRGMQSVIDRLGTDEIARLRIGVGPLPPGRDAAEYVLERFPAAQHPELDRAMERAVDAVREVVSGSVESGMNRYNALEEDAP